MAFFSSSKQYSLQKTWVNSLRLYAKVLPQVWLISALVGCVTSIYFILNMHYKIQLSFESGHLAMNTIIMIMLLLVFCIKIYLLSVQFHRIYVHSEESNVSLNTSLNLVMSRYGKIIVALVFVFLVTFLGAVAFVIPGIFIYILLIMVHPLVLFDNAKVIAAIQESVKLVWGNWWKTFILIFPVILIGYLLELGAETLLKHSPWCLIVANILIITVIYPLYYVCVLEQLKNLK